MSKLMIATVALVLFSIGALAQNPPTLRVVSNGPDIPADLFYGNAKVRPLRLRPGTNQPVTIDDPNLFVSQQYFDFLNRKPDAGGFDYWTHEITKCGSDPICTHLRRVGISGYFFISPEFQDSGYFIYRFYKATLGRQPNYDEFTRDHAQVIAQVVNGSAVLDAQKKAFADAWVQRPLFLSGYPSAMSNSDFVNKLFDTAQLTPFTTERQQQIAAMNGGKTRSQVIQDLIEIQSFKDREFYPAFVRMEYFGYLRRDPDAPGEAFWVDVLTNRAPGNFYWMVCSFVTSPEYQLRFSDKVTHTDKECVNLP